MTDVVHAPLPDTDIDTSLFEDMVADMVDHFWCPTCNTFLDDRPSNGDTVVTLCGVMDTLVGPHRPRNDDGPNYGSIPATACAACLRYVNARVCARGHSFGPLHKHRKDAQPGDRG